MIICPKCHKRLEDNSNFCTECGTALNNEMQLKESIGYQTNRKKQGLVSYTSETLSSLRALIKPLLVPVLIILVSLIGARIHRATSLTDSQGARNGVYRSQDKSAEVVIVGNEFVLIRKESGRTIFYRFSLQDQSRINISAISNGTSCYRPKDFGQKETYRYQVSFSAGYNSVNINFDRIEADFQTGATGEFSIKNLLSLVGLDSSRLDRTGDAAEAKQKWSELRLLFETD